MNFKITNKLLLCAGLLLSANAFAAPEGSTPSAAPKAEIKTKLATKTEWASGLKEPQGMGLENAGNILIADYGAGKILRYSRDGKLLGTLVEGLKGPSQIVVISVRDTKTAAHRLYESIFVSERKANRVIQIEQDGKIRQIGLEIEEPLGLVVGKEEVNEEVRFNATGKPHVSNKPHPNVYAPLFVVSHTTSKIFSLVGYTWEPIFTPTKADRYGYRCLAYDNGTLLLSDEEGGEVLMLSQSGRLASWAKGIADPSGIAIGPDGATYVTDESEGGRLYRVNNLGEKTIVAEDLGRPRGILFLDAKNCLVSDRNGKVWKLVLP